MQVPPWPQSITWYNSEGKIDDSETPTSRYKQIADGLGGYALEVKPTEACDQGEWKCVAKSEQGAIAITTCDIKMISKCLSISITSIIHILLQYRNIFANLVLWIH